MTNKQKLDLLNTMEVLETSASCGELEYILVENSEENRNKLVKLGATEKELDNYASSDGEDIDISYFAFTYARPEWFQESLGGFLEHKPAVTNL